MADSTYGVYLGLDVGKGEHHTIGLDPAGDRLHDSPLPNSEPKLRALFDRLEAHGRVLVVVDQPATIGALPVAVARACGHEVAYLPGLAMRRIADLYPGNAKTDLLTELPGRGGGREVRGPAGLARFPRHDQRREPAAGAVRTGGAAVRVA